MHASNGLFAFTVAALFCGGAVGVEPEKVTSTSATKGGISTQMEKDFRNLDRDGDGYLSKAELKGQKKLLAKFADADKNHDGKLDLSEFQVLQAEASPDRSLGAAEPAKR